MERHTYEEIKAVADECERQGINILDCWMANPEVRTNLGNAIKGKRDRWIIQGHIGATWQNNQYNKTRDMKFVKPAFEDFLTRFQTDYVDLGMIHFVDSEKEFDSIMAGSDYIDYVRSLKRDGTIRHIGLSTHNPKVAKKAVLTGEIEMILFSVNPAFDLLEGNENMNMMEADSYKDSFDGIAPERVELYNLCAEHGVGLTVMKGYAGGRLFDEKASPFGAALTPVQCLHYALTRPTVASVLVGYDTPEHVKQACAYETATASEKDYASVLASAPKHAFSRGQCTYCGHCAPCPSGIDIAMVNKYYDLAAMQPTVPDTIKAHYHDLEVNADSCIACGGCESRCPFGVKVIEKMEGAKKLFG